VLCVRLCCKGQSIAQPHAYETATDAPCHNAMHGRHQGMTKASKRRQGDKASKHLRISRICLFLSKRRVRVFFSSFFRCEARFGLLLLFCRSHRRGAQKCIKNARLFLLSDLLCLLFRNF
jgi:hypothetical protein